MTDMIQKQIVLKAPRERVWNALADSRQFGAWFGMRLDGPFVAGTTITGAISPTTVSDEVAAAQKPYEGTPVSLFIDTVEPITCFAFRWHPYATDPNTDYSAEPMTLVSFVLSDTEGGTQLILTESGFDALPEHRRAEAIKMNDGGWTAQMQLIEAYLAR